ncbi:MAG: sugar transferase, partial [Alphaproteobacteria bacterium]|nr:sugar transferase [Alphaproteobacteria bacterium]
AAVALIAFHVVGLFRGTWSQTADADLIVVVKGASLVSVLLIAGMVLTNTLAEIPRSVPLIHWFITVVALYGSRMLWAKHQSAKDAGNKSVAILVGCSQPALRFLSSVQVLSSSRFKIFGMLDDSRDHVRIGRTIRGAPVVGHIDRADECLAHLSVHGVFPDRLLVMDSFRRNSPERFSKLEKLAERTNIEIDVINDSIWLDDSHDDLPKEAAIDAKPLLSVKRYMHWRHPVEWLIAMLLVTVLSPLFLLVAGLCLLDVGRPVFFWQMRPGRHLKPIKLIKFRTMKSGLGKDGKPLSDEKRTSAIGYLIRRSKLDELPQLLSIIRGDMSFIGPRPLLPRDQPDDAELRAIVRPGVTGWAQVNGGHPLEIEEKLALDIWYIQNASLWLDIKVAWLTVRTVLFGDRVDREAIDMAEATRELLRPAAKQLHVAASQPALESPAARKGEKRPDQPWWPRPVDTLDRAS